jgi:hypothetical protein
MAVNHRQIESAFDSPAKSVKAIEQRTAQQLEVVGQQTVAPGEKPLQVIADMPTSRLPINSLFKQKLPGEGALVERPADSRLPEFNVGRSPNQIQIDWSVDHHPIKFQVKQPTEDPKTALQVTQLPESTPPAVKDTAPAVDDTAPAVNDTTPAVDDTAPAVNDTTPAVDDTTPAVDDTAPAVNDTAPAVNDTAPAVDDTAPAVDDTAPAVNDTAPAVDDTAPAVDDTAPAVDDTAPAVDGAELAVDDTAPAVDDTAPAVDDTALAVKDTAPAVKDTTPAVDDTAPAVNDTAPAVNDTTPAVDDTAPAVDDTAPAVNDTAPAVDDTAPAVNDTTPAVDDTAPAVDDAELAVNDTTPAVNDTAPAVDDTELAVNPHPDQAVLIQTDPNFTQTQHWLDTDYMQKSLSGDHDRMHKRLGDGFYEQRLIREQLIKLTGQRSLSGYRNDEEQFKALMNAGIRAERALNLTPGVALSAEQMARLTEDIVWLVNVSVMLPDGRVQTMLAPQVYVRTNGARLSDTGILLSGSQVNDQSQ